MDLSIRRDDLSLRAKRDIENLAKKFYRTGELSKSTLGSLQKYHDNEETRGSLMSELSEAGLHFNPFKGQEPAHPWYQQGELKAPYNAFGYKSLTPDFLNSHAYTYAWDQMFGSDPRLADDPCEARRALMAIKESDDPEFKVDVYRVKPNYATGFRPGDWVTLSESSARKFCSEATESSHIMRVTVQANQLFWDPTSLDLDAIGYDPRERAPYRDIPGLDIGDEVIREVGKMKDHFYVDCSYPQESVERLEKFYNNPATKEQLIEEFKAQELPVNPYTGRVFELPHLDNGHNRRFDRMTVEEIYQYYPYVDDRPGDRPEMEEALQAARGKPDQKVTVYLMLPDPQKGAEGLGLHSRLEFRARDFTKFGEGRVIEAEVPANSIFWCESNFAFLYDPRPKSA